MIDKNEIMIDEEKNEELKEENKRVVHVIGYVGVGKTSSLCELLHTYMQNDFNIYEEEKKEVPIDPLQEILNYTEYKEKVTKKDKNWKKKNFWER